MTKCKPARKYGECCWLLFSPCLSVFAYLSGLSHSYSSLLKQYLSLDLLHKNEKQIQKYKEIHNMAIEAIFLLGYFKEMFLFCQGTCILNDLMELFKVLTFWLLTISVAAEEGQQ